MSLPRYPKEKISEVDWLGSIPAHWKIDRIKASLVSCKNCMRSRCRL
jgi:type I restriction enzyme S subunit